MNHKIELAISIILLLILGTFSIYIQAKYLGNFMYYREIVHSGLSADAVITNKEILNDGRPLENDSWIPAERLYFDAEYSTVDNNPGMCRINVSKTVYNSYSVNDKLVIVYLKSKPGVCYLQGSAEGLYFSSMVLVVFGIISLLIFIAFAYHVYKSFKKTGKPVSLTTKFEGDRANVICPECGSPMDEGYIPGVGGINWRDRGDPIGLPTMISGLPGTVFWFKRPLLHAFNCKQCALVVFKYRKK